MAWKADNSQSALSILAHGITSIDGGALAADVQGVELVTTAVDVATRVSIANPLPVSPVGGTPWSAVISTATSGDSTLLVAQGVGVRIYVTNYVFVCEGAVTVKFRNGTTDVTGPMPFVANDGITAGGSGPLFWTSANALLAINLSAAVGVRGHISGYLAA